MNSTQINIMATYAQTNCQLFISHISMGIYKRAVQEELDNIAVGPHIQ
jgi:hypothetical protein